MKHIYKLAFLLFFISMQQLSAQCYMERHNTSWNDGWLSCEKKPSPNPVRPSSHWIQYTLGNLYKISDTYFWNYNEPKRLDAGAKRVAIDYSTDGIEWKTFGEVDLIQANGDKFYEGQEGPDLGEIEARYILITVLQTYGHDCAGIAEVKFNVEPILTQTKEYDIAKCIEVSAQPNPFSNYIEIKAISQCNSQPIDISILDATGRVIGENYSLKNQSKIQISTKDLAPGIYFVKASNNGSESTVKVIKIE